MPHFVLTQLRLDQTDEAYPLMRMAAPDLTFEQWQHHASKFIATGGGILGVFAGDGLLHGIAAYRQDETLRYGRTLRVDTIVTFELTRAAPARRRLCEGLDLLAEGLGCKAVVIAMGRRGYAEPSAGKCEAWSPLGFQLDSVIFAKRLSQEAEQPKRPETVALC